MSIYDISFGPNLGPNPANSDIVDGENTGEEMNPEYNDENAPTDSGGDIIDGADGENDIILGNGGDDVINAGLGDDEVYGGSGNDVIDGGEGNDTITGDFANDVTDVMVDNSTVEGDDILEGGAGNDVIYGDSGNSLSAGGEGVLGTTLGDGPGSTGGGYDRVYAQSVYNGNHSFSTDAFYLGNDIPVLDDANRNAITGVSFSQDGVGTDRTFGLDELEFTGAQRSFVGLVTVQNVDVHNANDQFSSSISGGFQDVSVVSSGTADFTMNDGQVFQGIRVNFVRGPDGETYMMPDDGPSPYAFNAFRAMLFNNSSGIDSFTIATGSGDDAGINPIEGNWADGQFFELTEGDGGDDTIIGGEGADQMFGEGGDDTFVVGSAAEGAGDVITGGNGPDETTDFDVLDLRGAGSVTIDEVADATDVGATTGTVTFNDGSTLEFSQIEDILVDEPAPDPITVADVITVNESGTDLVINDMAASLLDNDTAGPGAFDNTVATVNGALTNVNVPITGSHGGTLTVFADGTVEFSNDGNFTDLMVGESRQTTFTYAIQGGQSVTVVVTVEGETNYASIDDVLITSESETAGDIDGNVLSNDLQDASAYSGQVLSVNGDSESVGSAVAGSNGGLVTLNADGSYDFDANGAFDTLAAGQSAVTSFTYEIEGGQTATLEVTVEGEDDAVPSLPALNVAIILQSSSTMFAQGDTQNFLPDWADYNDDGVANQQIDLAYAMIEDFVPEAVLDASNAGRALNIALIGMSDTDPSYDLYVSGTDVNQWIDDKVAADDSADYGQGFENASDFFGDVAATGDDNLVFFIGNGFQTGTWQTERAELVNDYDANVDAFLTDLVLNTNDPNYKNLSAMDDDGFVHLVYTDDGADSGGFGVAQDALQIDEYLI